jgi:ribosomal protein L29
MDLNKLTINDVVTLDTSRLYEVEKEIRQEMAMLSMDVYSEQGKFSSKKRGLKRGLAKVLTVRNQKESKKTKKSKVK